MAILKETYMIEMHEHVPNLLSKRIGETNCRLHITGKALLQIALRMIV